MPNSTKASQNRMFNLKNTNNQGGASGVADSRNDGAEANNNNLHKSYNGNIARQGGGLQPQGYKGNIMPMINSGKGLSTDNNQN
jgi:hypothetical protein